MQIYRVKATMYEIKQTYDEAFMNSEIAATNGFVEWFEFLAAESTPHLLGLSLVGGTRLAVVLKFEGAE